MGKYRPGFVKGSSCLSKLDYKTMENGQRCADNANRNDRNAKWGKVFAPYQCHICNGVHLTSHGKVKS